MTLASAKKNLINRISGTHRYRCDEYFFAAAAFLAAVVELSRDVFDPRLFFRAVGEHQFEATGRRCLLAAIVCRGLLFGLTGGLN